MSVWQDNVVVDERTAIAGHQVTSSSLAAEQLARGLMKQMNPVPVNRWHSSKKEATFLSLFHFDSRTNIANSSCDDVKVEEYFYSHSIGPL